MGLLKKYKKEVIRLEKQREIEETFSEEVESFKKQQHLLNVPCGDSSCGYDGCPAK